MKHYSIDSIILKKAVSFKVGSSFIYQDSLTGFIDSFSLYISEGGSGTSVDETYTYDWMRYRIKSNSGKEFSFYTTGSNANFKELNGFYALDTNGYYPTIYITDPFQEGHIISHVKGEYACLSHYKSLSVKNKVYDNVYVMTGRVIKNNSSIPDTMEYKTYYSPDAGLLKFEAFGNSNYYNMELINSNIIK